MASDDRFVTLDGMRGLAALIVAFAHVAELLGFGILPHAHLAVDFFFVLSGFVIAHAYERRLATCMSSAEFLRRRIIRLHPLIVIASSISAGLFIAGSLAGAGPPVSEVLGALAAACLLIPFHPLSSGWAFPLDGPAWSLFAEYWINILYAFVAPSLTPRRLQGLILVGLGMLLILFGALGNVWNLWLSNAVGLSVFRVFYPFFTGVLLNRIYRGRLRLPRLSPLLSISVLCAILLAPPVRSEALFDFAVITAVFPLLVIASTRDRMGCRQRSLLLLSGRLSYPIYTLHFPLALLLVPMLVRPIVPHAWSAGALALSISSIVAISYLVLRYVDEPLRAWLGSRRRLRQAGPLAA